MSCLFKRRHTPLSQSISLSFYGADESTKRMMQAHVVDAIDDPASEAPHTEPCLDHSVGGSSSSCVGGGLGLLRLVHHPDCCCCCSALWSVAAAAA